MISVVIPTLNEEKYIKQCLASLDNQIIQPDEIIVVDSGSTDKTVKIAKSYGCKILNGIKNVNYNRDLGIRNAKYTWVVNTDADTTFPDFYMAYLTTIIDRNTGISLISGNAYPAEDNIIFSLWRGLKNSIKYISYLIFDKTLFWGCNFVVNKQKYIQCGGYELTGNVIEEDINLYYRLLKVGREIYLPNLYVFTSSRRLYGKNRLGMFGMEVRKCMT